MSKYWLDGEARKELQAWAVTQGLSDVLEEGFALVREPDGTLLAKGEKLVRNEVGETIHRNGYLVTETISVKVEEPSATIAIGFGV